MTTDTLNLWIQLPPFVLVKRYDEIIRRDFVSKGEYDDTLNEKVKVTEGKG